MLYKPLTEEEIAAHFAAIQPGIEEQRAREIRQMRNDLLLQCDWTQIADAPVSPEKRVEWLQYRQQLRDITAQTGFPHNVTWPIKP